MTDKRLEADEKARRVAQQSKAKQKAKKKEKQKKR